MQAYNIINRETGHKWRAVVQNKQWLIKRGIKPPKYRLIWLGSIKGKRKGKSKIRIGGK